MGNNDVIGRLPIEDLEFYSRFVERYPVSYAVAKVREGDFAVVEETVNEFWVIKSSGVVLAHLLPPGLFCHLLYIESPYCTDVLVAKYNGTSK